MSKQFFSVLGDQLCTIRNSPFYRLGQKPQGFDNSSIIRSQLSYDPDRLFNKQHYEQKNEGIEDKDFIQMIKQQQQQEQRIEFNLLREATREDFQRKIKELNLRKDQQSAPKQFSIFRNLRSFCRSCHKCTFYRGNFKKYSIPWQADPSKSVEFLSCIYCRCSMNSHQLVRAFGRNRQAIWSNLKAKRITDKFFNIPYFIAAFKLNEKNAQQQIYEVAQLLEKIGLKLKNYCISQRWVFEMGLLKTGILAHNEDPSVQETLIHLANSIAQAGRWVELAGVEFEQQFEVLRRISNEKHSNMLCQLNEDDVVMLYLIEDQNFNSLQQKKQLQALQQYIKPASLLYISNDKRQSIFMAQEFFTSEFTIYKRLFLLPQLDTDENVLKLRDILDYNGYSTLFQNPSKISRLAAENVLSFLSYHELTYILGKQLASQSLSKLPLIFAAKPGPSHLDHYGVLPSFLQVEKKYHQQVFKQLFSDYAVGQRCIVVLRPLLAGSGFEQTIVNLLRINNFTIVQRVKGALSLQCGHYLAALEHISQQEMDAYISLMTTGICQILLISKKSALYEAHVLLNQSERSLSDVNPRWIRNRPSVQIKRGRQIFKQQFNFSEVRKSTDIFKGASSLFNIANCLFGNIYDSKVRLLQNCRTGELIKITDQIQDAGSMKVTLRQREEILRQLKKDNFNYLLFNSKSDKSTEQLVSLFFPECTLFESAVVIVKPSYLHLLQDIKQILAILRYHIIFTKTVQLSRQFAEQLINDLQKLKLDHQTFRQAVQMYSGQKVVFLCISKLSAKKQLLFMLSNFNFLPTKTILQTQQSQNILKQVLIPIWNNQQYYLKIFNRHLSNLQQAVFLLTDQSSGHLSPQDELQLNEYFIGSIFATKPDQSNNTAIGKLSLYQTQSEIAKFQSWYYATLSNFYPNSVPLLFQFRNYGKATLVIQSHSGEPFITAIMNHYLEEKKQRQQNKISVMRDQQNKKEKRNSIVLLLWAKKIFKFIQQISILGEDKSVIPIEVQGWGRILYHNNQYRAQFVETQCISKEINFIQSIIAKFSKNRHITANCKKMLQSRVLPERYKSQNRRLLPNFNEATIQEGLRVVEKGDISKLYLKGQFQMIDPDNQKNTENRNLLALNLYRVIPYVGNRYSLMAQFLLFFDKLKQEALQHQQIFSEISEHLNSFLSKFEDLQFLQFQIYLKLLRQLDSGQILQDRVRAYPTLRKGRARIGQEVIGKNRKFLQQKQYFKSSQQHNEDALEQIRLKYTNFNLKSLQDPIQTHILNKQDDFLHKQWATQGNVINLLRQQVKRMPLQNQQRGIFVQYQKKLNQNEEKVKQQIQSQVKKLGNRTEQTILKDKGIDDDLWYKRIRSGPGNGRVDDAISKQLQKLNKFKMMQEASKLK